jgi:GT2 family glycosyltransferase
MWNELTKLGWAMPLTWPYLNSMTHISLMGVDRPNFVYLETSRGGDLAEKRELQVEEGLKQCCTEILLLDADMVYPPQVIKDLYKVLNDGADMVGGLCYRGYPPYNPLIWHPTEERQLQPFKDYQFGDIVEGGSTGAACLLVKSEVFQELEKPWFQIRVEEKTENGKTIAIKRGEDTFFCRKATKAGFKLKIITEYDIGHLREFAIDRHFWITYSILNTMGNWENAFKLFNKLTDKEWFEREIVQTKLKGGK